MHAIVCSQHGGPEVMQYAEIPRPEPAAGEILVEAEAIGVNYVDTMRRSGKHPAAPEPPFTPGIEVCGRVVQVASGVRQFTPGDRVISRCVTHGTYAEYVCTEERFTAACPEDLPAEQGAALFVNGQTAYHVLVTVGGAQASEWVSITAAAGGVGTCAVQIAKALGTQVLAAAGTEETRQLVRDLGADVAIDYTQEIWSEAVHEGTGGQGATLILESIGGDVARECVCGWAPGGRMVVFGKASGQPAVFSGDDLLFGDRSVHGLAVGTVIEDGPLMRQAMDQLVKWLSTGQLRLQVGQVYPLSAAAEAHRDLESRRTTGKLILKP